MNKQHIYNFALIVMILGTTLNTIKLSQGFILWWISNSILLYKATIEGDKIWKRAYAFLLFSSIFGYGYWIINS